MNNQELFADLFAYRFMLLDAYGYLEENAEINEIEIIKKLKYKLIQLGRNYDEINELLFDFYNHYEINISLDDIRNAQILLYVINNSNINVLLTNLINNYINNEEELEETNTRLTDEEINRIPITTVEETLEDTCSICFETISVDTRIFRIPCNHKFHMNCLRPHLINYSRNCPLCRNDCFSNNI